MAMQMARARSLAQRQLAQASASATLRARKTQRQVTPPITVRAQTPLPPVGGLTETLQDLLGMVNGEVEPWQPWGGRKGVPKGLKEYDNVYVQNGRVWAPYADGTRRMLGYTPTMAKKRFKTKRRRKRLTKRDMYILSVIEKTGQTGLIGMML
jgi:hypothetical protein